MATKLSADTELQSFDALKAVWQYINGLDDADEVVLLDASRYSNYDILCWNNALCNHDLIISEVSMLLDDTKTYEIMSKAVNPYGDGNATSRIVLVLKGE